MAQAINTSGLAAIQRDHWLKYCPNVFELINDLAADWNSDVTTIASLIIACVDYYTRFVPVKTTRGLIVTSVGKLVLTNGVSGASRAMLAFQEVVLPFVEARDNADAADAIMQQPPLRQSRLCNLVGQGSKILAHPDLSAHIMQAQKADEKNYRVMVNQASRNEVAGAVGLVFWHAMLLKCWPMAKLDLDYTNIYVGDVISRKIKKRRATPAIHKTILCLLMIKAQAEIGTDVLRFEHQSLSDEDYAHQVRCVSIAKALTFLEKAALAFEAGNQSPWDTLNTYVNAYAIRSAIALQQLRN